MKVIVSIISFVLGFASISISQDPITLTRLSKDSIILGENVDITLSLHRDLKLADAEFVFDLSKIENLAYEQDTNFFEKTADVEILNSSASNYFQDKKFAIPLDEIMKSPLPWSITLKVGVYSVGAFNFPMPIIVRGSGDTLSANRGNFLIVQPPPGFGQDSTKVINEIKPIIEIPSSWQDYLPWVYSLLGILVLGLLLYWLSKRKRRPIEDEEVIAVEPEVVIPAHIIALKDLNQLQKDALWTKGEIKKYQSELTRIIRQYLEGRYNINALEKTSGEIITAISKEPSMMGQTKALTDILTVADLVKFAKATPSNEIHEEFLKLAFQFVNQTKLESNDE